MAKMTPPLQPEVPVPVLADGELKALLATCAGKEFDELRDQANIRLFIDTGMRGGELAGLDVDDLDLDHDNVVRVLGKAGVRVPVRSARRLPRPSTAISAWDATSTGSARCPTSGSRGSVR
jgi:integrase